MSWAGDNDIVNLNSNYIAIIYIDVYSGTPLAFSSFHKIICTHFSAALARALSLQAFTALASFAEG